ncbi:gliding motility-associated peptidyl-prolyl isomerase GldI [Polaribacter sp. HL-MS24]|uniref:gliding motility-associated peptidyl-prolyl isomerase GldI n=1 Tax=Polaribacter sp. HL-MS24 TaxID=3077735 RepID=UPI0029341595|nr:gliding motility-associated peptidyl-prolyl isomerase GldI [Polaribacter sp. HL-MS24]WOC40341.1 gliding motility-associated peptidyl-prolyl isomerase GldI [Polaribacter sp. HL-MS24]
MKTKGLFVLILIFVACSKNEARRPLNPKPSTTLLSETVDHSKALNEIEVQKIEDYIANDSLQIYEVSKSGFWYSYQKKVHNNASVPVLGDEVIFEYQISDLYGNPIYTKEELGLKKYLVDKEDFISALQKGIKLMKVGETVIFVIPSYHAFGISGDGNKIGMNQTIKSTVTLLKIN